MTAGITGATRVYLHLAHPSAHARTPQVMNAEFARRGVDAVAVSADVAPGDLGGFARGLHGWRNLAGLSVTMPYKEALAAHVDELAGPTALIGAVNVVRRESDGRLVGGTPTGRRIWYLRRYRILRAGHFLHANSRFCSDSDGLAGRDHGYVGGEDFAAFVVEVADVDRAGGAAYPAEHAGALGAGQVLVTPLLQCAEDHLEFPAGRGPRPLPAGGLTGLPRPASIWMYQGGSHLLCPVSGGRAPEAAGRRGGGST